MIAPGEPRLLALDLDGTLLDRDGEIPVRSRIALERLQTEGVEIVLASGRVPAGMRRICLELGLDGPQITMQGALIVDPMTGEVLRAWRLEPEDVLAHIAFAESVGAVALLCFEDGFRSEQLSPAVEALFAPFDEPLPLVVPSLRQLADERPVKTFLYTPPGTHDATWDAARLTFAGRASVTSGDEKSIELLPVGVSKGEALRALAAHRGIPLTATAAIGDARNDIEMLRIAGRSAAMRHGRDDVRAAAQIVVGAKPEEGVLEAIDAFYPSLAPLSAASVAQARST